MKLTFPFHVLAALTFVFVARAEQPSDKPQAPMKQASAHGVTFIYASDLTLETEVDDAGTKLYLKNGGRLPSILVQVYTADVTPEKALEVNTRHHRELCVRKDWKFTELPIREEIAGKQSNGTEITFTANDVQFRQRFLTLSVGKRTVFVMTMCKSIDDELARNLLKPIATSMR